jgi:mRNA interferase MazF
LAPPARGEVWLADLDPVTGREQAGTRPILIVSANRFNRGSLVVGAPLTRTDRGTPMHVRVEPPEGGLRTASFVMCEHLRALSHRRLLRRWGAVEPATMQAVAIRLRRLLPDDR